MDAREQLYYVPFICVLPAAKKRRIDNTEVETLRRLDDEILLRICWMMPDLPSLLAFSSTCRRVYSLLLDEDFWCSFLEASLKGQTRMVSFKVIQPK